MYLRACKESTCNAGDLGSIPGSERPPGEKNGYPLRYSCLENPHEQRNLAVHGAAGSDMTERLTYSHTESTQFCEL